MKKALLFAILTLSINAFAQSNKPTFNFRHPTSNSLENVQVRMENEGWQTSYIYSEKNLGEDIKHQTPEQRSFIQIYDSIYNWQWDTLSIGWKIEYKIINIVYDANNNLTSELIQQWNGSAWENWYQYTYTYDANNNLASKLYQRWNGSAWENWYQYTYTYNANNNRTSYLSQTWNGSVWENLHICTYIYDANNNLTSEIWQLWNGNIWENWYQYTYTYDINNNQTSFLSQTWNGSVWENSWHSTYAYDANNYRTSELWQLWNGSDWENWYQYAYTYNADNDLTSELDQQWNGSAWVNSSLSTYTYDANNNQTSELWQNWNGIAWVIFVQSTYTYDANYFTMSKSYKGWNSAGTIVTSGDSTYYYFHTALGINDLIVPVEDITVYPNPSSGKFTISSNSTISSIEIYNILGERIYSNFKLNRQTSYEIDLSDQAKGIYLINIYNGTKIYSRKIVVQ